MRKLAFTTEGELVHAYETTEGGLDISFAGLVNVEAPSEVQQNWQDITDNPHHYQVKLEAGQVIVYKSALKPLE